MAAPYTSTCSSIKTTSTPPICSVFSPFSTLFLPFLLFSFSLFSFFLLFHTLFKLLKPPQYHHDDKVSYTLKHSLLRLYDDKLTHELNSTQLSEKSIVGDGGGNGELLSQDEFGSGEDDGGKKKKRRRRKGKKNDMGFDNGGVKKDNEKGNEKKNEKKNEKEKEELVCLYPFTNSSSATQRKIKQHYDQLVKCNDSNGLTLTQVGEFVNCLVDARNELQLKSECIKRKFTITKALLLKADRSSFDRLRKKIYKLELEQKRIEEDAFVYNWLQRQLKLSPAYKKMVEVGASMESKAKAGELPIESPDDEQSYISFEEFLAQEKKDAFWQKYSKPKPSSD